MISPVVTVKEGIEMNKQTKTKIGVESVVKAKVGELEKITRERISRRTSKEVVLCLHNVVGKKNYPVKLCDGKKKEIISSSLVFLGSKEEVNMDEAIL